MTPGDLKPFLQACLEASASFIGLLYVGLSVVLQRIGDQKLADRDRALAESSYAGLVNIFFISLVGTLPHESIGYVCMVMALLGLLSCWRLKRYSHVLSIAASAIIYLIELGFSLPVLTHGSAPLNLSWFQFIIFALFGLSLVRAWNLMGIRQRGDASQK